MSAPTTDLPLWQRERLERFCKALGAETDMLDDRERRFLTWLAGWDYDVEADFLAIVELISDLDAETREILPLLRGDTRRMRAALQTVSAAASVGLRGDETEEAS